MPNLDVDEINRRSVEWPLDPSSTVLEIGGYKGRWARLICERYAPRLYAFEPQVWAFDECRAALAEFPQARVFNYGLGIQNARQPMGSFGNDGCSFLKGSEPHQETGWGEMREIGGQLTQLGIEQIDLCLINIEGYEYTLLPYLLERGLLARVQRLMVQFHLWADPTAEKYHSLRREIERSYGVLWDFGSTLVAWERVDSLALIGGERD